MCLGCIASSVFWDSAGEVQQPESPEELHRKKLDLLRERLEGKPVRLRRRKSGPGDVDGRLLARVNERGEQAGVLTLPAPYDDACAFGSRQRLG